VGKAAATGSVVSGASGSAGAGSGPAAPPQAVSSIVPATAREISQYFCRILFISFAVVAFVESITHPCLTKAGSQRIGFLNETRLSVAPIRYKSINKSTLSANSVSYLTSNKSF
jgi:hypothetical protein